MEDRTTLAPGFAKLDKRERYILHLRFFEGLTQSQIAERVGISQMHVSRLIRRSLEKLREEIGELDDPLPSCGLPATTRSRRSHPRPREAPRERCRHPRPVQRLLRRERAPRRRARQPGPRRRRQRPLHDRRHAAVQAVLPRRRDATGHAHHHVPALLSHLGHRERGQDRASPHLLRDARQLLVRRLLQGRGHRLGARAVRPSRHRPRQGVGERLRRRRPGAGGRRGRRAVEVTRLRRRAHRPPRAQGQLLGARRAHRAVRARARSCTTTSVPRWAATTPTAPRAATAIAFSSTGTWCSCSTTWTRPAPSRRCPSPASTPAWASSASP